MARRKIHLISKITSREILDSRGNPTVEATVHLDSGLNFKASAPSGASTGSHEAVELRDNDKKRYSGKGVLNACKNIDSLISDRLKGIDVINQKEIDEALIELDGTDNKQKLGANATIAVSLCCAKAGASVSDMELHEYVRKTFELPDWHQKMPTPMFNIFNGGKHADTNLNIQEFMVVPIFDTSFAEKVRAGSEMFHQLGNVLHDNFLDTDVGNEGGYAPNIDSTIQAFDLITEAIAKSGYKAGAQIGIALDIGASELYDKQKNVYNFELDENYLIADQLITLYRDWSSKYPIISIEDGLAEDAWEDWVNMSEQFSMFKTKNPAYKMMLVGDDLVTTNLERLKKNVNKKAANAVIVKPNQIGTLLETVKFVKYAQKYDYKIITSHRSGETTDDYIADLAIAFNSDFVKFGSTSRGERTCKYNRLMEIEQNIK